MANTYTQLYIHIVSVVRGRMSLIPDNHKIELYKYMTGIIQNKGHKLLAINGMPDHVHFLIGYDPHEALSALVKEVKRCSTNFINEKGWIKGRFSWQEGYGAFSYAKSQLNTVCRYIENQEQHHKKQTFREEYVALLKRYEINYDERYVFSNVMEEY
ncbi:IS200/IS605 family transposase [bacterium]|nr:IS200/IS605 family transposase [bacterium]NUN45063.1 IS200/IS605 family transposase [bacterium]HMV25518.1 IS200/IS605 family transposase [bacterium]HMW32670.1 IS200/IS605 family transposase [bacterium]HMW35849.1 IS200/IS605 family transposase [bacterium]